MSYNDKNSLEKMLYWMFLDDDELEIARKTREKSAKMPRIVDVIYNKPATIVFWSDGTKTVVKCGKHDKYTAETGLAMAIVKKLYGNTGRYYDIIRKWLPEDER